MKKLATILCGVCLMVWIPLTYSNNISVSNVSLEGQVVMDHYCLVEFDISWDNSWRTTSVPQNWDAAWVFIKYSVAGGPWHHAKIDPAGSVQPAGCSLDFADTAGVFVYRDTDGNGTFSVSDIGIRWSYGDQGVNDDASVEVKVFAIEMVYIPQGDFYLGDGHGATHCFYEVPTTTNPYLVSSDPVILGTSGGYLRANGNLHPASMIDMQVPAEYPIGYKAFYSMKYEISQEQYVDFLNTLSRIQQNTRTKTDVSSASISNNYVMAGTPNVFNRNGIMCVSPTPNTTDPIVFFCNYDGVDPLNDDSDGQNIACNHLTWMDVAAYADWAGLRPMTEPEFEKSTRGPNAPVSNEYAWGNASFFNTQYTLIDAGLPYEQISNMGTNEGNLLHGGTYINIGGPGRCGIFAASSSIHARMETGASYYGVMEMSGNLVEMVVVLFNPAGISFQDINGDGSLTNLGNANTDHWPGIDSNTNVLLANPVFTTKGVMATAGISVRGGYFGSFHDEHQISSREHCYHDYNCETNHWGNGGRLVRTAPIP